MVNNIPYNELKEQYENQIIQINNLKRDLKLQRNYIESIPQLSATYIGSSTRDNKIIYRNWWSAFISEFEGFCDAQWFSRFLKFHFPNENYKINMFSVFGEHINLTKEIDGKKVLFSGENLNYRFQEFNNKFGNYALDYVDFSMGYDLIEHYKYLRFPLWILYMFPPNATPDFIEKKINDLNNLNLPKTDDVCVIASHDNWNTRSLITNDIENFVKIKYAGRWKNNTSDLWNKFNDNKREYLKQFKFNICAENLNDNAYVTEKIFQAIESNCIPLYLGGGDYLEPMILNDNAILRWDFDNDNSDTLELFKNLITDNKSYIDFKNQNIFLDNSAKYIIKLFEDLKKHFERLIF